MTGLQILKGAAVALATLGFVVPSPKLFAADSKAPAKKSFGEFVKLTTEEHAKLVERFGEKEASERIEALDHYIGSKGKKYKSHYHTVLTWARRDDDGKGKHDRDYEDRRSAFGDTITV